ncbi:hypothetical protein CRU87_06900 [Aliarcobacter trophiarum LMG 25534]|uniref:Uncharacterized protein n=1 Tax=Aliarcobacter trophiarum LMG 25534 TaxID=1032241 RepID=A0AAD0QJX7_9BACT|nr:hypothetical protein [Aliarcobacter trophiarum]AXK49060.1 hypothetical protein ATR_1201 [Aliarcobacter trophiarum LMG 25534]RXI28245.1 hypothetical protein CRU89_02205 [Aliarcobacter trophiarum]RXJ90950.1 hypothetical protein CRU87_06900 [Aliarcobacter trophiarum LMG 25534]
MNRLPHQKPIRFVNEILKKEGDFIYLSCSFPFYPTLAMVCEAAAQSSVAFSKEEGSKIGFLLSLKDIELLKECNNLEFEIRIKKDTSFDSLNEFSFELLKGSFIYAKGSFIVKLQD